MRRYFFHLFSSIMCLLVSSGMAYAATITVGKDRPIQSINKAIQMAQDGDSILVEAGYYDEGNIRVDKKLAIIGINKPVIDGKKKTEPFSIRSPYVLIQGFVIKSSGHSAMNDIAGVKIYNTHHVTVKDNVLEDNFFGIYAQNSKHCQFINNKLQAYGKAEQLIGNGIHGWKSDSLTIQGNVIKGHRDGIYLEFVTHTEVENNLSDSNLRYGLHFMFSHDNSYIHNTFRANGAGVAVMYTNRVTMKHNVFEENWGDAAYGLLLKDISDSEITNNRFDRNTTAIFMEGSNRCHLEHNEFMGNGWALKVQASCMDNTFFHNNFFQNTFDVATNGSLSLNTFKKNYWDKYEGYDIDRDGVGDIPYRPVSLFSMLVERYPTAMILFRSFMVTLFDRTERLIPSLTPESLKDDQPLMKSVKV